MATVKMEPKLHHESKNAPLYRDPFNPFLKSPNPLNVTDEQNQYIKEVLDVACSDSRFSQKAFDSINLILTGAFPLPSITSLSPSSAAIGDPSFDLHILGKNFDSSSVIVFASHDEPTTLVSDTEVTTGIDMSLWLGPDSIPVMVRSGAGFNSNIEHFTFTPEAGTQSAKVKQVSNPEKVLHDTKEKK